MPTDKKAVEQIGSMTTTFKEMLSAYDAQNAAKLNQATDKVDNAVKALETFGQPLDKNIETLTRKLMPPCNN